MFELLFVDICLLSIYFVYVVLSVLCFMWLIIKCGKGQEILDVCMALINSYTM